MNSVNECFESVKKDCLKYISSQETKTEKFKKKDQMIKSSLIPISFWIAKKTSKKNPIVIGLAGGQGSGKTTISSIIKLILSKYFKLNVFKISIDDFYKTRKERIALSKKIHPLLMTRGVPGTHDVEIMSNFLKKIKNKSFSPTRLPRFDKSIDDRVTKKSWYKISSKPDVVIFEGWCVGAKSQSGKQLKKAINPLERNEDKSLRWRKHVNNQLSNKYKRKAKKIIYHYNFK